MLETNDNLRFYTFFTQYTLMEDYGFTAGLFRRAIRKFLPAIPSEGTIEYYLLKSKRTPAEATAILDLKEIEHSSIARELDLSIKALCAKITAFGLDNNIQAKLRVLGLNTEIYEVLLDQVDDLNRHTKQITLLQNLLTSIEESIHAFRKNKNKIGTNLHLTVVTKRILEYVKRVNELLILKQNIHSKSHWEALFIQYVVYTKEKNSIRRFLARHLDLLLLEIVEHTSNKGEKYIADNQREYWSFLKKSLLGGAIIAIFALCKMMIAVHTLSSFEKALYYSFNYALCFIVVKQVGGLIATKQPAMTASTLAKQIDRGDNLTIDSLDEIVCLIRKVFRSQSISLVGNFCMALASGCLIAKVLHVSDPSNSLNVIDPAYLMKQVKPSLQLVWYAAIAGFFLAFSGLISGYFDNKVVASNLSHRIKHSKLFFRSASFAKFIEEKGGGWIGNISLGIFLGSAFLMSYILPLPFDIRHIAFSSANVGYAIMNQTFTNSAILFAVAGVALIGLTNFLISFSITLFLALRTRGATWRIVPRLLVRIFKDFLRNAKAYFVFSEKVSSSV